MTRSTSAATLKASQCPICWDEVGKTQEAVVTECGHRFCVQCIKSALYLKKECPVCRAPIKSHRELRRDSDDTTQREGAGWSCPGCGIVNVGSDDRCKNDRCNGRRPCVRVPRRQAVPQRYTVVPPRSKRRRAKREQESTSQPVASQRRRSPAQTSQPEQPLPSGSMSDDEAGEDDVEVLDAQRVLAPRPRGRSPKGKEWVTATGQWVVTAASSSAAPTAPGRPNGKA
eukprot:3838638-Prymnesium_polylepis.1